MWDVPRYRIRAYVRAKRKSQQARASAAMRKMHIRRAGAEIRAADSMGRATPAFPASLLLNELTPKGVMLFSEVPFSLGQRVNLTLSDPKLFFVRGRVVGCQNIRFDSKIMRERPVAYRVMVVFEFQNLYEREQVRLHCSEIARSLYPDDELMIASPGFAA